MDKVIRFGAPLEGKEYGRRIGAYAVIVQGQERKVATIRTSRGHHFLPGGGVENGETHSDCLRREVIEELGYEIEIVDYIGSAEQYFISTTNVPTWSVGHFYTCTLLNRIQSLTKPEHEICWSDSRHIEKLMFLEHQAWAVKQALDGAYGLTNL